jgi:hypothetical protein
MNSRALKIMFITFSEPREVSCFATRHWAPLFPSIPWTLGWTQVSKTVSSHPQSRRLTINQKQPDSVIAEEVLSPLQGPARLDGEDRNRSNREEHMDRLLCTGLDRLDCCARGLRNSPSANGPHAHVAESARPQETRRESNQYLTRHHHVRCISQQTLKIPQIPIWRAAQPP